MKLPLNLQFFADDNSATNTPDEVNNTDNNSTNNDDSKQDHMIPKSRFDEINEKYKNSQKELEGFKKQQEDADKKRKEEQGKFEELYQTASTDLENSKNVITTQEERIGVLEGVINGLLETKLTNIPKDLHDLIPNNLTPEAKLEWLNKAEQKGLFGSKVNEPVGELTNGNSKVGITKEQFNKMSYKERAELSNSNPTLYRKLAR